MKQALVVGGARSGKYVSMLLSKHGYQTTLTDINKIDYKEELEALGVTVIDCGHPKSLLDSNYDIVVKNPGIPFTVPFIQQLQHQGYDIVNEIDVALSFTRNYHVAAITGTNGKTTTTILLEKMLSTQFERSFAVGNIGQPLSEIVYNHEDEETFLALELSSFQLMSLPHLKPKVATITNLKEDHLDFHKDLDEYYGAKQNIYKNQDESDFLLVNRDDKTVVNNLKDNNAEVLEYSLYEDADIYLRDDIIYYHDVTLFSTRDLKVVGEHNVYNAIVASMSAYLLGVSIEHIQEVLKDFGGVEHRLEYVDTINDRVFYNDSKSTNVDSTVVALKSFEQPVILLIGGHDKHIDLTILQDYQENVKEVITFGDTKDKFKSVYPNAYVCDDLEQAFKQAILLSGCGDTILLSPACSSYDQYDNFEQRGNHFKRLVNEYKRG